MHVLASHKSDLYNFRKLRYKFIISYIIFHQIVKMLDLPIALKSLGSKPSDL